MISVIIPAHNEEAVITRGLRALTDGARPGEIEVIVACNGCTDGTGGIARSFGPPVRVIDVERASKIEALNDADAVARGSVRIYVDADVQLGLTSVRRLVAALQEDGVGLVAPRARTDLRRSSWVVRAYYQVWTALPYNRTMVGTGVYALSGRARMRFDRFPDVIADDGFVRFLFDPSERKTVQDAIVSVEAPRTLADLVRVKTRSRLGQLQLRRRFPHMKSSDRKPIRQILLWLLGNPRLWPALPIYLSINVITRIRAKRCLGDISNYRWERDASSRKPPENGLAEDLPSGRPNCSRGNAPA